MYKGYVRTDKGAILVQIPSKSSRWGFVLADEENSWEGGFGIADWDAIPPENVQQADKDRLGWILLEEEDEEEDEEDEAEWHLVTDLYGDYSGVFTPEDFDEMLSEHFEEMFGKVQKPTCRFRKVEDKEGRWVAEMYDEDTGEPLLRQRWKK